MRFEEEPRGLLHIHYPEAADLKVDRQALLVARLEQKRGPVVLIFEVGPAVRSIEMDVPTFWLGVTARPELQLVGMGIVTQAAAVRVAARGFALANVARRVATEVQSFGELSLALTWGRALLAR